MSAETRAFFDRIAPRYERAYALSGEPSRERLARLLALLGAPKRILDLGVGPGRELTSLQGAGHDVLGLELSPEMIALCNRRARPIPITLGDLWAPWPLPGASFDAVIALHGTLAHPPSADGAHLDDLFANAARVLRPKGLFFAELPTIEWLARGGVAAQGTEGRFVDDVNGAAITIRLFPEATWKAAALGFDLRFEAIADGEVRLCAEKVS